MRIPRALLVMLGPVVALAAIWNPDGPYTKVGCVQGLRSDGSLVIGRYVVPGRWRWFSVDLDYPLRLNLQTGQAE